MSSESFVNDHCLETNFTSLEMGSWKLSRRRSAGGKIETGLLRCAQYVHSSFGRAYYLVKINVKSQVQRHHNPRVGGSNPSIATSKKPFDIGIFRVKGLFSCAARSSTESSPGAWLSQSLAPRWSLAAAMLLQNLLGSMSSFRKLLSAVHSIAGCLVSNFVVDDGRWIVNADLVLEQRLLH